jgi:hypothetical protein
VAVALRQWPAKAEARERTESRSLGAGSAVDGPTQRGPEAIMWLEAIITEEDFLDVMKQFLPVKIYLHHEGEEVKTDRWLLLQSATEVDLIANEGLQVTCPAELVWGIAGMSPTVKVDALRVMIRPQVTEMNKGNVLEFHIQVEEADFHSLPSFIDGPIVKAINLALATKKIPWNFTETLTRKVPLGKMFDPVEELSIKVEWGKMRIEAPALTLVISFKMGFVRGD